MVTCIWVFKFESCFNCLYEAHCIAWPTRSLISNVSSKIISVNISKIKCVRYRVVWNVFYWFILQSISLNHWSRILELFCHFSEFLVSGVLCLLHRAHKSNHLRSFSLDQALLWWSFFVFLFTLSITCMWLLQHARISFPT